MHGDDFTALGRDFASAPEERVECRLIVVVREERGRNEDSYEAHEDEYDEQLEQCEPGRSSRFVRLRRDHEGTFPSLEPGA